MSYRLAPGRAGAYELEPGIEKYYFGMVKKGYIALLHNPAPVIDVTNVALTGSLNPGCVVYFKVPTYQRGYHFNCGENLAIHNGQREMAMHVLPQARIFALAAEAGISVCKTRRPVSWTGAVE